jgi:hypothetical protein
MGAASPGKLSLAEQEAMLVSLEQWPALPQAPKTGGLVAAGAGRAPGMRLKDLPPDALADLLVSLARQQGRPAADLLAIDEWAQSADLRTRLAAAPTGAAEWDVLRQHRLATSGLVGMGAGDWWDRLVDRASEATERFDSAPLAALSKFALEARGPLNEKITLFVGDVFAYLAERDQRPGAIRGRVLTALKQARQQAPAGEPLVVVTHSMGGQIVFDLAESFLENEGLRIDFWVATASQVGLFEEMKLFIGSDPAVEAPRHAEAPNAKALGYWWNVWDPNDVISYTAAPVFGTAVDDESYEGGASLAQAHSTYLQRPSFYRALAAKLTDVKARNYYRP